MNSETMNREIKHNHASHAIMFHHFHDSSHLRSQGSISAGEFERMIIFLGDNFNILSPQKYIQKADSGSFDGHDICLTFDDALKCQIDVAVPLLKKYDLHAFFFIYSSVFTAAPDLLEVYRYFRSKYFNDVNEFYEIFFRVAEAEMRSDYEVAFTAFQKNNFLKNFEFYSDNDRWFRFLRDMALRPGSYHQLMSHLFSKFNFDPSECREHLWMSEEDIRKLASSGHEIGLHSFSHPTRISQLGSQDQLKEYQSNFDHLSALLGGKKIRSMSHPCGDYNSDTLNVLENLGIEIGFRSNMDVINNASRFEWPRRDHAVVLQELP